MLPILQVSKPCCGRNVCTSRLLRMSRKFTSLSTEIHIKSKKFKKFKVKEVTRKMLCFELGMFLLNWFVYYLTCGFIASTRAFNLPTLAFNLETRAFSLQTRGLELVTRGIELVTRRFELVTRISELVTRNM